MVRRAQGRRQLRHRAGDLHHAGGRRLLPRHELPRLLEARVALAVGACGGGLPRRCPSSTPTSPSSSRSPTTSRSSPCCSWWGSSSGSPCRRPTRTTTGSPGVEPVGEASDGEAEKTSVWPDLVYTEMLAMILVTVVLIVWAIVFKAPIEEPANPAADAEPLEGALVLPGAPGDARLLRPVAGGRRLSHPDHRRPHGHPLHRQEPEGERLLHLQGAQGRDHHLPLRLPHPLGAPAHPGHVPARAQLELLRALRVLGHRTSSRPWSTSTSRSTSGYGS